FFFTRKLSFSVTVKLFRGIAIRNYSAKILRNASGAPPQVYFFFFFFVSSTKLEQTWAVRLLP
ncbi:unnamed protein product, partial [Ixodes persulcatus]